LHGVIWKEIRSKLWEKWVTSTTGTLTLKKVSSKFQHRHKFEFENGNIEYNFEKVIIETVTSNLTPTFLTSTVKRGQTGSPVGGWLLMMIGDAMPPFDPILPPVWPRFTVDVKKVGVKFDVTVSILPFLMINSTLPSLFFDVTSPQIFDVKLVLMLQFSMFPYSMLPSSIKLKDIPIIWQLLATDFYWPR